MVTTHNLGFPRIGAKRELKFGLESYWKGLSSRDELNALGRRLRARHWNLQKELDLAPVGDFHFMIKCWICPSRWATFQRV